MVFNQLMSLQGEKNCSFSFAGNKVDIKHECRQKSVGLKGFDDKKL